MERYQSRLKGTYLTSHVSQALPDTCCLHRHCPVRMSHTLLSAPIDEQLHPETNKIMYFITSLTKPKYHQYNMACLNVSGGHLGTTGWKSHADFGRHGTARTGRTFS